ncbi:hypothetical protein Q9233_014671 [Columba guinea]|nr:hypothetical protein Q9233_014671 [Columba guinea]
MTSSYNINAAAPLETTVKGPSPPENWNNFNTFCPDYKQNHQSLELLVYCTYIFFPLLLQIQDLQKYQSSKKRDCHMKESLEEVMDKHVSNFFE